MKKVFAILAMAALASCGGSTESNEAKTDTAAVAPVTVDTTTPAVVDSAAAKVDSAAKAVVDTLKKK